MVHQARHSTGTSKRFARPPILAGVAVAAAGITLAVWLPTTDELAEADDFRRTAGRQSNPTQLTDDFSGRRLDLEKWAPTGRTDARVFNGRLDLAGTLTSKHRFTGRFGHAEARIRTSRAAGVDRTFGLLDENRRVPQETPTPVDGATAPASGRSFHTYVIDWTPETVTWTVDGEASLRLDRAQPGRPLVLALNLGADGRGPGRISVDFVAVRTGNGGPPTAPPTTVPTATPPTTEPQSPPPSSESPTPPPTDPEPTTAPPTSPSPTSPSPSAPTPSATPPAATAWAKFTDYAAGDRVTFDGATYRVLEAHTSLPGWEPPKVPSLFAKE
jgi:carbohydrate binding protein with CBM5/12 domain/glycosyl hydrolase family 16